MSRLLLSSLAVVILDAICLLLSSPRQRGPEFKLLAKNISFPFASSSPSPVPAPTTTSPFQAPTPPPPLQKTGSRSCHKSVSAGHNRRRRLAVAPAPRSPGSGCPAGFVESKCPTVAALAKNSGSCFLPLLPVKVKRG